MELLKEFKPALIFLGKFLAFYVAGNILYGIYIESFKPHADEITFSVACQTSWMLKRTGYEIAVEPVPDIAKLAMKQDDRVVLYFFEGCNGLNVMIVFAAFVFALGGSFKRIVLFLPFGLLVIHFSNLLRIALLFSLAANNSTHFYYYHKYLFTATLYLVVFGLWALWVLRSNEKGNIKAIA